MCFFLMLYDSAPVVWRNTHKQSVKLNYHYNNLELENFLTHSLALILSPVK